MSQKDLFSQDMQLNARQRGEYDDIANNVGKCVFCDLKEKYILYEEKGMVITVNLFPYIDGQLLIVPRRHVECFKDVTKKEWELIYKLSQKALKVLKEKMKIEGVWMLLRDGKLGSTSGKTVKHLHWNILPYNDELNTWHYQKLTIAPIKLAEKLRLVFKKNDNRGSSTKSKRTKDT